MTWGGGGGTCTLNKILQTEKIAPAGSEVITTVVIKCPIFRDIMPSSKLTVNRRFGTICCLRLQDRRISRVRNQRGKQTLIWLQGLYPEDKTLRDNTWLHFEIAYSTYCCYVPHTEPYPWSRNKGPTMSWRVYIWEAYCTNINPLWNPNNYPKLVVDDSNFVETLSTFDEKIINC
jgi:hypothetical protein